ncbi:MAG TPA: alpha/beta fold hydrolase [Gemmatimonadaceae bacterium]
MTLTLALPVLALALLVAHGRRRARALEREVGSRLPLGPEGVIVGAGEIRREGSRAGGAVLLLHGFGDTPQTLGYLADALHARGWTVHAPLLPGHGRTLRDFAASRADEWERAAYDAYDALRARHERVAIVGLSMGGALATLCARRDPAVPALVLLAPYLGMPSRVRRLALTHALWSPFAPFVVSGSEASIHDESERVRSRAYGAVGGRMLRELLHVVERASDALPGLAVPTLVVHSRDDHRIAPADAERAYARIASPERRLVWLDGCGHLVTVDRQRERVFELTLEWLERHVRGERGARHSALGARRG